VDGPGQRRDALFELHPLIPAGGAPSKVSPDLEVLGPLERAEQMLGQEITDLVTGHRPDSFAISARRRNRAERIRVFTVPCGIPSSAATSAVVRPPK
jgi:hypothetical protein